MHVSRHLGHGRGVLFEESPHVLQQSLRNSMDEIYRYDNR
jgi:hypothetical protein